MKEKVTVLIPVYNREKYLEECLDSVFNQSYKDIRVLVYDDGSTDVSPQIARKFPLHLMNGNKNRGVSYARNQLLEACKTHYAMWHDSDDISNKYRVAEQLDSLKSADSHMVHCQWKYIKDLKPGEVTSKEPESHDDEVKMRNLPGALFDFDKLGHLRFCEQVDFGGEDLLWLMEIEKRYGQGTLLPRVLYYMRYHRDRISSKKKLHHFRNEVTRSNKAYDKELARINNL